MLVEQRRETRVLAAARPDRRHHVPERGCSPRRAVGFVLQVLHGSVDELNGRVAVALREELWRPLLHGAPVRCSPFEDHREAGLEILPAERVRANVPDARNRPRGRGTCVAQLAAKAGQRSGPAARRHAIYALCAAHVVQDPERAERGPGCAGRPVCHASTIRLSIVSVPIPGAIHVQRLSVTDNKRRHGLTCIQGLIELSSAPA